MVNLLSSIENLISQRFSFAIRLAQMIIIAFSLAVFFSYGLQFYVPVMIVLPFVHKRVARENHLKAEFALRYGLVILTCKS